MNLQKISNSQTFQLVLAACLLLGLHWASTSLERGWLSWWLSLPPLVIIVITALARINDITATGKRWFFRRLGLLLVAGGALSLGVAPLLGYSLGFPSWTNLVLYYGMATTWITTPNMPPWWKYVSGEYKLKKGQQA